MMPDDLTAMADGHGGALELPTVGNGVKSARLFWELAKELDAATNDPCMVQMIRGDDVNMSLFVSLLCAAIDLDELRRLASN